MANKPKFLFHASSVNDLEQVEPRSKTVPRNFEDGPCIFATHEISFATEFLVPHDDSWANGGSFGGVFYFVISDIDKFKKADIGGTIYLVNSKTFKRYNRWEWYTKRILKPIEKITFSSGLMAMISMDVQVYSVNKNIYKDIQNADDHGMEILNSIESENEKFGYPTKKLDMYKGSKIKI